MGRGNEQCKTAEEVTGRFPGLTCSARANVLIGGGGSCCWEAISDGSPVRVKNSCQSYFIAQRAGQRL